MAIDPRNYDLDELRAASVGQPSFGGRDALAGDDTDTGTETEAGAATSESTTDSDDEDRPAASVAFERSIARDLAALEGRADPERPYLRALPASLTAEALIFEWLEFLVMQGGRESVADALDFYERVGWLGGDTAETLERYLSGIEDPRPEGTTDLDADDHRVSLHYVARLVSLSRN